MKRKGWLCLLFFGIFLFLPFFSVSRRESQSCLSCHTRQGLSVHRSVSCTSCHLGNSKELSKQGAHQGVVRKPGNLRVAAKTCGRCHQEALGKLLPSLMVTGRGIVERTRLAFSKIQLESSQGKTLFELGNSPADSLLRALCVPCHLAYPKLKLGKNWSLGGGCTACHKKQKGKIHPAIQVVASNSPCLPCHSRSSRISLSYEGWHEVLSKGEKRLPDGREVVYKGADVHHKKGLLCIDCHLLEEIMGDGRAYRFQEEQREIQCSDCHVQKPFRTLPWRFVGKNKQKRAKSLGIFQKPLLISQKRKRVFPNVYQKEGQLFLVSKASKRAHLIPPLSQECYAIQGHKKLSCQACHSQWAPQCIRCHIRYQPNQRDWDFLEKKWVRGKWEEKKSHFLAGLPSLGKHKGQVVPVVPGMIFSLHYRNHRLFERFFTPFSPHTTGKSRDCLSCHQSPLALGLGRGKLQYKKGKWIFSPYFPKDEDTLPWDGWIPLFGVPRSRPSLHKDCVPFSPREQRNILRVGLCLHCHPFSKARRLYQSFVSHCPEEEKWKKKLVVEWRD